ncbi:CoA-binding protein [Erysipelothrix sp. P66]|uniref:CoA-binding protein n=1 Tax=Erysipelothrix sp. P66 TaxID=3141531 RepID=UPI00315DC0F2
MNNPYEILNVSQTFVIAGINNKPESYAYRIYKLLEQKGKTVLGVNPNYTEINGKTVYPSFSEITDTVDVAVMVVNPKIGIHMLESIKEKGINVLWLQPGTVNDVLRAKAKELDLNVIEACVLKEYAINEQ